MAMLIFIFIVAVATLLFIRRLSQGFVRRSRFELRALRTATAAVPGIRREMELLYQLHQREAVSPLPAPPIVSPFSQGAWQLIAGDGLGWSADSFYKVRGLAVYRGVLFASLTGPNADGPIGQVWKLTGQTAIQVGGDLKNSWKAEDSFVDHLFSDGASLLAAEKSGVWSYDGEHWSTLREGLQLDDKSGPYSFAKWQEGIAMGQWGAPHVALLNPGGIWSYLPDPEGGWGKGVRTIYCLTEFKGRLYAGTGTGKLTGQASSVWRFDGSNWEKIGGDGIRGSWARDGLPFVLSLTVFGEALIATVSRPEDTQPGASSIWVFDGDRWSPLTVCAIPALMASSLIMNDAIVYRGQLVVATGHSNRSAAQIWALDSKQCWQPVGPTALASPGPGDGGWWVYRLCTDGERLYASTAGHKGAARVFCFTPTSSNTHAA